jgi:hypothetical protein
LEFVEEKVMANYRNMTSYFVLGLMFLAFSGIMLCGFNEAASAEERGHQHREFMDSRYHHDHSYPARGQFVRELPRGYRVVVHGNSRYYFNGGVWYRPEGGRRFAIIAPPIGLIVPFLPPYYATIWVGGIPYYYANEVYYTQGAGGYIVVEPPRGEVSPTTPQADQAVTSQVFVYPRQGQSEKKQADDRYECHRWAANQTGYDPTRPPVDLSEAQLNRKHADYQRASAACLDGRGYTVK